MDLLITAVFFLLIGVIFGVKIKAWLVKQEAAAVAKVKATADKIQP
jgi:hypothetical protein